MLLGDIVLFSKWEACGNDFIVTEHEVTIEQARTLCDRHYGVGADGVLLVSSSDVADAKMTVLNADGSIAEMCGNGIRCVGRYVGHKLHKAFVDIETGAGIKQVGLGVAGGRISVGMGEAKVQWHHELELVKGDNRTLRYENATFVNMGNPHCVLMVSEEETKQGAVERFGRKIEKMTELFPEGTNVEFVTVEGENRLRVKVWERGCGRTLACGTGACASAYAAHQQGLVGEDVTVELDGGEVEIRLMQSGIELIGPARRVYVGEIDLDSRGSI